MEEHTQTVLGAPPPEHGMGRLYLPDPRDEGFLMASALPLDRGPLPPKRRRWRLPRLLDQGRTERCVDFAWCHFLGCTPVITHLPTVGWPGWIYERAQAVDGFALPHEGTTVRAAAKVVQGLGWIGPYLWGRSVEDVAHWLLRFGPVVAGTVWTRDMQRPTDGTLSPTGPQDGGHAYLLYGVDVPGRFFWVGNSWGPSWGIADPTTGQGGCARLPFDALRTLLEAEGEACTTSERRRHAAVP